MIDLRHLRYAVAVADEAHLTRAAERLGIQQPPLSQQIKAIETFVGTPLFTRLPRGMALTEAGRVFVERARQIIADVDSAVEATRRVARGEEGRLSIGFITSAAFHPFVATCIRTVRETAPGIALQVEEGSTSDLIQSLRTNRIDAGFIRWPIESADDLCFDHLLDEDLVVAMPERHRLARPAAASAGAVEGGTPPLRLEALAGETFVLYRRPTGIGLYDLIIAACRSAGFSPQVGQEAPKLLSTLSLISAGLGLSIIPSSMAHLGTNGIAYRRLEMDPPLTAPLFLAYRAEPATGAPAAFIAQVRRESRLMAAGSLCSSHM
jgi:DNA-binding transcriptional LysR family regulator